MRKAIGQHDVPAKITIDKSAANTTAIASYNLDQDAAIELRQVKCLNNAVEQDHRAIKRQVRPMMGFTPFWSAAATLAGIELMHMIREGQLKPRGACARRSSSIRSRADFQGGRKHDPLSRRIRDRTAQSALPQLKTFLKRFDSGKDHVTKSTATVLDQLVGNKGRGQ